MSAARRSLAGLALASLALAPAAWAESPAAPAKATRPAANAAPKGRPAAAPAPSRLPPADAGQLGASAMAHVGEYACEFNEVVTVALDKLNEGYIDVRHRKSAWIMKPVLSSTGALRLEDVKGRMLMLQIANKSMLMDTKAGQRLVDGCVHEKQRDAVKPSGPGLGIEPAPASAAASAPTS